MSRKRVEVICKYCGKHNFVYPCFKNKIFCDSICYGKWKSENQIGENHPKFKATKHEIGKICQYKFCLNFLTVKQLNFCSRTHANMHYKPIGMCGKSNPNYNNGKYAGSLYSTIKWKNISQEKIKRDNGKCMVCDANNYPVSHHVIPGEYTEYFFDEMNIITVCQKHQRIFHQIIDYHKNKNNGEIKWQHNMQH